LSFFSNWKGVEHSVKFRADRDTLLDTLVTAARATSARAGLSFGVVGLRLLLRGDQLDVCGSDPDLVIEARCQVAGDTDGSVLVPSRLVVDIVRSFEPGAVAVAAGDEEVRFSSGGRSLSSVSPSVRRSHVSGCPEQEGIEIPGAVFADGLRQVVRAALVDDSRAPQLTGVLMVATDTGLRLIATDSYRLAFRDFAGMNAAGTRRPGACAGEGARGGPASCRQRERRQ
jgi:DNA polymerase-3 subunit beta